MGTSVPVGERHRDCELIKERKGDSRRGSIRNGVGSAQLHTRVGGPRLFSTGGRIWFGRSSRRSLNLDKPEVLTGSFVWIFDPARSLVQGAADQDGVPGELHSTSRLRFRAGGLAVEPAR